MTLADEDTNSILTDNANRAIQCNVAMQVTQPGGQLCKKMQVAPSGGQILNKFSSSFGVDFWVRCAPGNV